MGGGAHSRKENGKGFERSGLPPHPGEEREAQVCLPPMFINTESHTQDGNNLEPSPSSGK